MTLGLILCAAPVQAQDQDFHQVFSFGRGTPYQVIWSPDSSQILVSTIAGIWIYDSISFDLIRHVETESVYIRFSPDGRWLLGQTNTRSQAIEIRDAKTYERMDFTIDAQRVSFSPDGAWLIAIRDSSLYRFDTTTFTPTLLNVDDFNKGTFPMWSPVWSPDGRKILLSHSDGSVHVLDAHDGHLYVAIPAPPNNSGEEDWVYSIWMPDSSRIIRFSYADIFSGGPTDTLGVYETATGKLVQEIHQSAVFALSFNPDGQWLNINSDLYDAYTLAKIGTIQLPLGNFGSAVWSPDSQSIIFQNAIDGIIKIADLQSRQIKYNIQLPRYQGTIWLWSPDNRKLLGFSGKILIWDMLTGQQIGQIEEHIGVSIAGTFSSDNSMFAAADSLGKVRVWNTTTGRLIATFTENKGAVELLLWQPNGHLLATGRYYLDAYLYLKNDNPYPKTDVNKVYIWDTDTGRLFDVIELPQDPKKAMVIAPVTWSPDGQKLVFGNSKDSDVRVWDAVKREQEIKYVWGEGLWPISFPAMSWSPDGQILKLEYDENSLGRLFDARTGKVLVRNIFHAAFDPMKWSKSESQLRLAYARCVNTNTVPDCSVSVKIVYDGKNPTASNASFDAARDTPDTIFGKFAVAARYLSWSESASFLGAIVDDRIIVWGIDTQRGLYRSAWTSKSENLRSPQDRKFSWSPSADRLIVCMDADESQVVDIPSGDVLLRIPGTSCPYWGENDSMVNVDPLDAYIDSYTDQWNLNTGEMREYGHRAFSTLTSSDGNVYVDSFGGVITLWSR